MKAVQNTGSGLWKHGLLLTLLFGFTTMIVGGVMMFRSRAPIPVPPSTARSQGQTLFTADDVQQGQELFRKRGLMNYGTVLGHGAYLGPDYTAEALHLMTHRGHAPGTQSRTTNRVGHRPQGRHRRRGGGRDQDQPLQTNRTACWRFTAGQERGWNAIVAHYAKKFDAGSDEESLPQGAHCSPSSEGGDNPAQAAIATKQLAAFITWTAWLSAAKRPGEKTIPLPITGPYDKAAGNTVTAGSMMWSAVSVAGLLFFLALILYFQHRYSLTTADVPNPAISL